MFTVKDIINTLCSCSVCLIRLTDYGCSSDIVSILCGPCSRLDESLRDWYTWKVDVMTVSAIYDDCLELYIHPA